MRREATYCQKIKKEDGYFTTDSSPHLRYLDRMITAYYPLADSLDESKNQRYGRKNSEALYPEGKIQMEGKNIVTVKEF